MDCYEDKWAANRRLRSKFGAFEEMKPFIYSPSPSIRAAAIFAYGTFIGAVDLESDLDSD